jgi:hypothetical protein
MTFTRLLVLGDTHPPESAAAHLASSGVLKVEASAGHVPATMDGTALWATTKRATSIRNAGVDLPLLSPGPAWLSTVPGHFLGRKLVCTTLGRLRQDWQGYGAIRLAEQQYGTLGYERGCYSPETFIQILTRHRSQSPYNVFIDDIHVIDSVTVKYTDRYRIFIANGEISASTRLAAVLDGRQKTQAYEGTSEDQTKAAEHFARQVIEATIWHQPPGFRIDVGTAPDGSWQLISSGPSWDAEFLEANPTGVVNSILAGQAPGHDHWKWTPDEFFQRSIFRSWPAAV